VVANDVFSGGCVVAYGVRLHVWGDRACFTRPETKVERVSYDVMTPSAARGILEAIHWKPSIRWIIDRIHVLKPIRFESIRRNELGHKISERNAQAAMTAGSTDGLAVVIEDDRQQRAANVLKDVGYGVDAHFDLTANANPDETEAKHLDTFRRRVEKGKCFHRPCLGTREFAAHFGPIGADDPLPFAWEPPAEEDFGLMLLDIDFQDRRTPKFFRAVMRRGVVEIPRLESIGVVS
jgi:CRISPR-associated protein Cas5d